MFKVVIVSAPKLPNFQKHITRNIMLKIGQQIQQDINNRTKAGKDFNENSFIPYASSNKRKFGQVVDLTDSGQMLNSLKTKANQNTAQIYLNNQQAKKKASWNEFHSSYQRGFFGLSNKDIEKIRSYFEQIINRILRNG